MRATEKQKTLMQKQYNMDPQQVNGTRGWWQPIALLVFLIAVIVVARTFGVGERLGDLRDWIRGLGAWGPLVFVPLYAVAVAAALPGSVLTVMVSTLFGSGLGILVVSTAALLGAQGDGLIHRGGTYLFFPRFLP